MSVEKTGKPVNVSLLPSVFEVQSQLKKSGKIVYLGHTIRKEGEEKYIIEGGEINYCEFRGVGLALILIYLQRMLLLDPRP